MRQITKDHRQWAQTLKQWWIDMDYPQYCEVCGGTFGLAFAHSLKRRFIKTREQYFEAALLCQKCHEKIEFGGHEAMRQRIKEIINGRHG